MPLGGRGERFSVSLLTYFALDFLCVPDDIDYYKVARF